jgi:NhaA family Na+:H+ antiporter
MKRLLIHVTEHARHFLLLETAGGLVMIASAILAIALANSAWSETYQALIKAPLFAEFYVSNFTKDVLMVIFFFAIGMELKLEMREGALSAKGQKILPLIAAAGGIALPALLYLAITRNHPELQAGWAIPTATDIAFAMCVLRLVGSSVPAAAKIFLLAIAIYDDLAAILIIAIFYSGSLALLPLLAVAGLSAALYGLNRAHICHLVPYLAIGVALWFALHASGIHTTVAGVMVGIAIPMRDREGNPLLSHVLHLFHPYVAFAILPIFAFTSAGVDIRNISLDHAFSALPMGIALALFFGKEIGIFGATFAAVKLGIAPLPKQVNWGLVYGVSILAGIGFTMSLFIGKLAFTDPLLLDEVKLGVLAGSLLSTVWGILYLSTRADPTRLSLDKPPPNA